MRVVRDLHLSSWATFLGKQRCAGCDSLEQALQAQAVVPCGLCGALPLTCRCSLLPRKHSWQEARGNKGGWKYKH